MGIPLLGLQMFELNLNLTVHEHNSVFVYTSQFGC
jgi:hypothetical protein